jgi:hypothetical protein
VSVSNELSSDIATAILAAKDKSADELNNLKDVILEVHSTLQQLEAKSRNARAAWQAAGASRDGRTDFQR